MLAHTSSSILRNTNVHMHHHRNVSHIKVAFTEAGPSQRRRLPAQHPFLTTCAAAASSDEDTPASSVQAVLSGSKVTKSSLAKFKVGELRDACIDLGIDSEGTKVVLVDRLLAWATADAPAPSTSQQQNQQPKSSPPSANGSTEQTQSTSRSSLPSLEGSHISAGPPPKVTVTWLGTSSGAPSSRRNVSSIAVKMDNNIFLVDCGEGTKNQLRTAGLDVGLVSHIFVTHMHGDHCFGTAGVLSAICSARLGTPQQQDPIIVYGPRELQRLLLAACKAAQAQLTSPVIVNGWVFDPALEMAPKVVDPAGMLKFGLKGPDQGTSLSPATARQWQGSYDQGSDQIVWPGVTWSPTEILPGGVKVTAAQLQHRMPCWGYVFQEPDTTIPGSSNEAVRPGRKLVILGDTMDSTAIAEIARGCDLISHEATFNRGMEAKALIATHSTAEQAGAFARSIDAKSLVLTHFSARYEQMDKMSKAWAAAKARGVTMAELNAGVAGQLQQEAKEAAGPCKVYLANDYYTFTVPPQEVVHDSQGAGTPNRGAANGRANQQQHRPRAAVSR